MRITGNFFKVDYKGETGIYCESRNGHTYTVENNSFDIGNKDQQSYNANEKQGSYGITITGRNQFKILSNEFEYLQSNPRVYEHGVVIHNTETSKGSATSRISQNTFKKVRVGIQCEEQNQQTYISCNTFEETPYYDIAVTKDFSQSTGGTLMTPHGITKKVGMFLTIGYCPGNIFTNNKSNYHNFNNTGSQNILYYKDPTIPLSEPFGRQNVTVQPGYQTNSCTMDLGEHLEDIKTNMDGLMQQYEEIKGGDQTPESPSLLAMTMHQLQANTLAFVDSLVFMGQPDSAITLLSSDTNAWARMKLTELYMDKSDWESATDALSQLRNEYIYDEDMVDYADLHLTLMPYYSFEVDTTDSTSTAMDTLLQLRDPLRAIAGHTTVAAQTARELVNFANRYQQMRDTLPFDIEYPYEVDTIPCDSCTLEEFGDDDTTAPHVAMVVHPNPTPGALTADITNLKELQTLYTVKLLNYYGNVLETQNLTLNPEQMGSINWNIEARPQGYYFVVVFENGLVQARAVIIKN